MASRGAGRQQEDRPLGRGTGWGCAAKERRLRAAKGSKGRGKHPFGELPERVAQHCKHLAAGVPKWVLRAWNVSRDLQGPTSSCNDSPPGQRGPVATRTVRPTVRSADSPIPRSQEALSALGPHLTGLEEAPLWPLRL